MIKPIMQNPIVRKTAIGLMLAGAAIGASSSSTCSKTTNPAACEQTMSSAAAAALAAATMPSKPSLEHNIELDRRVIKLSSNAQELQENKQLLKDVYANYGTFAGTWVLQTGINRSVFEQAIKDFDESETKRLTAIALRPGEQADREDLIKGIYDHGLTKEQGNARYELSFLDEFVKFEKCNFTSPFDIFIERTKYMDEAMKYGVPSFEKCNEAIDNYSKQVNKEGWLNNQEYEQYQSKVNQYTNKMPLATRNSVQGKANIIAYKVFLLDYMTLEAKYKPSSSSDNTNMDRLASKFLKYIQGYYFENTKPAEK